MVAGALLTFGAHATSWQDSLSSAANQLSSQSGSQQSGGMSLSSLTGLLNGGSQSLTSSSMNNAAGIMSYCAKQKLASVSNTENVKNQVLISWVSARRKNKKRTPTILRAFRAC